MAVWTDPPSTVSSTSASPVPSPPWATKSSVLGGSTSGDSTAPPRPPLPVRQHVGPPIMIRPGDLNKYANQLPESYYCFIALWQLSIYYCYCWYTTDFTAQELHAVAKAYFLTLLSGKFNTEYRRGRTPLKGAGHCSSLDSIRS